VTVQATAKVDTSKAGKGHNTCLSGNSVSASSPLQWLSEANCQRSRISPGLRGCPSRNSPPRLSRNSPPWAVCLPGVGLAARFALDPSVGGWKGADGEEKYLDARFGRHRPDSSQPQPPAVADPYEQLGPRRPGKAPALDGYAAQRDASNVGLAVQPVPSDCSRRQHRRSVANLRALECCVEFQQTADLRLQSANRGGHSRRRTRMGNRPC
jgi:hypothetical protein